ncbi:MAG: glycosyltransferase, partial [Ornithinimicrobium sp.]
MTAPPRDRVVGAVAVVVLHDCDEATLRGLLDALVPQAQWCRHVFLPRGTAQLADHPLRVQHGVQFTEAPPGPEPMANRVAPSLDESVPWLWLLNPDSRPHADALPQMIATVRGSSRVAIVGPSRRVRDEPRVVITVGHRITRWGRTLDDLDVGAWDQGQFDERSDVIGVPTDGMLIRSDVLKQAGGVDPGFAEGVAGLDVSWRAHLLGHRVLVAPQAVVEGPAPDGVGAGTSSRDGALLALARCSLWRLPGRSIAMLMTSLCSVILLLALRRPRAAARAWGEASAVLWPIRAYAARWRFRGRSVVAESDLTGLFESETMRRRAARSAPIDGPHEPVSRPAAGAEHAGPQGRRDAIEAGPVDEEARSLEDGAQGGTRRWWSWPLAAAVAVIALTTLARWRGLGPGLAPSGWGVRG